MDPMIPDDHNPIAAARKAWEQKRIAPALKRGGERREHFFTSSGIDIQR